MTPYAKAIAAAPLKIAFYTVAGMIGGACAVVAAPLVGLFALSAAAPANEIEIPDPELSEKDLHQLAGGIFGFMALAGIVSCSVTADPYERLAFYAGLHIIAGIACGLPTAVKESFEAIMQAKHPANHAPQPQNV